MKMFSKYSLTKLRLFPVCFVHKFRVAKSPKYVHDEISYRNFKKVNLDRKVTKKEKTEHSYPEEQVHI